MSLPRCHVSSDALRVLVLASTYPAHAQDGTPAFVRDLSRELAREFTVTVLVPQVAGAALSEQDGGLRVRRFKYFFGHWQDLADGAILENLRSRPWRWLQVPSFFLASWLATRRALRRGNFDVVHAHWIIPQGIVARLALRGQPLVVTTLGGDLYALRGRAATLLKRWVVRRATLVTVMNREMAARVTDLGAARVEVAPMGADLEAVRSVPRVERTPGHLRLLFVGRLVEKKGLAVLLQALRDERLATMSLTVVGDGPLRAELEARAEGLAVTFLGQLGRDDLVQEYARHDVVVAPSVPGSSGDQDGLPVALLEAMGAGCGIVASHLPGIDEAVIHDSSGLLVPAGDPQALTEAIVTISDSTTLRRLAQGAHARAESLSVAQVGRRYRDLVRQAVQLDQGH
ncbi:MAG: hypothetical protein BGO96_03900 [Micrococcales bacterium 73-15]|uniref:glycosyltransferase n=1 Tax=Salana multivorans TaxID=120377 RepID=UPI00095A3A1C|nr:glycosyltransferase [Salana multivorans]OJX98336.1 MAG: hypothetical protein BGO96_03900 [Micrococcales bacterium 73-15]